MVSSSIGRDTGTPPNTSTQQIDPKTQKQKLIAQKKKAQKAVLEAQKAKLKAPQMEAIDEEARKRMETRAKARVVQDRSGTLIDKTNMVKEIIASAPLSIQQQNPTTVVAIVNNVVWGVSVGVRAIARRKEAMQAILSANEQILEAAAKSYEKIEKLTNSLEELLGQKTIMSALQDIQSSELTRSQKILGLLTPTHYLNTFHKFTDSLYITTNKAETWEQIKNTSKALKEEQIRFDDYIALLKIKLLEKEMMSFHLMENFDQQKKIVKDQQNIGGYKDKLAESAQTLDAAIAITDKKIKDLKSQQPANGGLLNRLKKTVGKDDETLNMKAITALMAERTQYVKQKEDVQRQVAQHQEMKLDPAEIKQERDKIKAQIDEIQATRVSKTDPEELGQEIMALRNQVKDLQADIATLKGSRSVPQGARALPAPPSATSPKANGPINMKRTQ
jgi:hypothetical protein